MIELINQNLVAFWFGIGFLLLAVEIAVFGFASGVLLFGGVGALLTGALLLTGWLPLRWLTSIAVFSLVSALSAALLWLPLKRLQSGAELGHDRSSDLIGLTFRLTQEVTPNAPGKTRFSGVDWRVEIDDAATTDRIDSGTRVRVTRVNPGVFQVVPDPVSGTASGS